MFLASHDIVNNFGKDCTFKRLLTCVTRVFESMHVKKSRCALKYNSRGYLQIAIPSCRDVMCECTDVLFTNADEARALCAFGEESTPEQAAKHLSQFCPLVSVTDGARGSYIGLKGEIVFVPPAPCVPVDTCGAGDAYAAGMLYGLLRGVPDLKGMGDLAARVAAVVVGQQGTRLKEEHAVELAESVNNKSELLDTRIMELMGMKGEVESEKISSV